MYRLNIFICLVLLLALTGCYQTKSTIEINPDGSGVMTSTFNFDKATEEQRQQIKAMLASPNARSSFNRASLKKDFPSPHFEILELEDDQENLRFKSVIKFKDINRLLAIKTQGINLNVVDFEVESDKLIFRIEKPSQQTGFGPSTQLLARMGGRGSGLDTTVYPKETIRFVDANSKGFIEFSHEYKGDDVKKSITWKDEITISGNTIKRNIIKYNFADYPVLNPVQAEFVKAAWNRTKQPKVTMSQSYLDLELKAAMPTSKDAEYLGFDEVYLLSGKYSDGSDVGLVETWAKGFRAFNNENNLAGKNSFKLPVYLSFPKSPVAALESARIRIRLLKGKGLKKVELGQVQSKHTYEKSPFTITTGGLVNDLSLEIKGPVNQINRFLVKTKRGNVFPMKESSWTRSDDHGSVRYWKFLPSSNLTLIAEAYDSVEYTWLDVDVPILTLSPEKKKHIVVKDIDKSVGREKQEKTVTLPAGLFKDKSTFENYWTSLPDDEVVSSLLEVSGNMEQLKENDSVYYWYQSGLVKKLKGRKGFFEANKEIIARSLFSLFLEMPDQNSNTAIAYFLTNGDLTEFIRDDALKAVTDRKLKNGLDTIFKGELSDKERKVFNDIFQKSDYWAEGLNIFKILTRGQNPDIALAQRVLDDKGQSIHVRQRALEVLIDQKTGLSSSDLRPYILHSEMRDWTLHAISNRLGNYGSSNQISKEKLLTILRPLIPVFEDLAEQEDQYKADAPKKILAAIQ